MSAFKGDPHWPDVTDSVTCHTTT